MFKPCMPPTIELNDLVNSTEESNEAIGAVYVGEVGPDKDGLHFTESRQKDYD